MVNVATVAVAAIYGSLNHKNEENGNRARARAYIVIYFGLEQRD